MRGPRREARAELDRPPRAADRAELDRFIRLLAQCAGDLTIEEFRERTVLRAATAEANVRVLLYLFGTVFMIGVLVLFTVPEPWTGRPFRWAATWAVSLGGLGGVAHVLLHVLKLSPQQPAHQKAEELEVVGRIFLGCIFSIVLTLALFATQLRNFADYVSGVAEPLRAAAKDAPQRKVGLELLFPFLCGYSVPLVLGLLDKLIQAVELTLALNEPRARRRLRTRRP